MAASRRAKSGSVSRNRAGILLFALLSASGCQGVRTREAVVRNGVRDHVERVESRLGFSKATRGVLARHHLHAIHPETAALRLEAELQDRPGAEPDGALALAELWYRVGLRHPHDPALALDAYRNAASAASLAAADPRAACPVVAVDLHNDAVARMLEITNEETRRSGASWGETLAGVGVYAAAAEPSIDPSRFASVDVADDIRVRGMRHEYGDTGMGVAVVALRPNDRAHPATHEETFLPPKQRVAATVVAVPQGGLEAGAWRTAPLSLVFHDPHQERAVQVGSRALRMSYDTTTPLAVQGSQRLLSSATFAGLLTSSFQQGVEPGLYMLRPYQRGKIPVVFIHGLSSNPVAFIQQLNDLGNDPAVAARYQFFVFAYPTGRPIPTSALTLRRALYTAESKFGGDPAFHQMVLIGHSMGGNLTRFMISESGQTLWDAVLKIPHDQLRASPETKAFLTEALIFHPVPFVRRAIFIAAPHRGSLLADEPLGRFASRLIRPPEEQSRLSEELTAANGVDVFKEGIFRNRSISSVGNLSPNSPVLLAVDRMPIAPEVRYHTISFQFLGRFPTDLVVPGWSSSLPGGETDQILRGTHFSEQSPDVVDEIRTILLQSPDGVPAP